MEIFKVEDLTFCYSNRDNPALNKISMDVIRGEFLVLMGRSGSGKSTLLRQFKPALSPNGEKSGTILFEVKEKSGHCDINNLDERTQASSIGFVLQNPDNQIVTDRVWHEMAFGLENLGLEKEVIRVRVAEMASFFGIQEWFDKDTKELSGGQKQILNLASVMVMNPEVLILDEPTSQLDPIAAAEFIQIIKKINREIGTTIIISEHRLDELLPLADRVIVMEAGEIIANDTPNNVGATLSSIGSDMFAAMPSPMQVYDKVYNAGYGKELECPIDVRGGRLWLNKILSGVDLKKTKIQDENLKRSDTKAIEIKDVWFRYYKQGNDIVRGLNLTIREGEIFAIVGGNGTGKTTSLKVIAGIERAFRGKTLIYGKRIEKYKEKELRNGMLSMLPQDPQSIFVEDVVKNDLMEVLIGRDFSDSEKEQKIIDVAKVTQIEDVLESHPYDISGGEQQRVALAKILLLDPKVVLLDEPTKGIDNFFKGILGNILIELKNRGKTIVLVSHDIEFSGQFADRCAMFFDGKISTEGSSRKFFSGNSFYTTSANKMSSNTFENTITADDVAGLVLENIENNKGIDITVEESNHIEKIVDTERGSSVEDYRDTDKVSDTSKKKINSRQKNMLLSIFVVVAMASMLIYTIFTKSRDNFAVVSILMILLSMVPFFFAFEVKKPTARELVLISVIVALGVAARTAFYLVPQGKPILAVVIAGSICMGPNFGFVIGAMSAFMSNFLFGQGPWTPWQMLGMGLVGMLAGYLGRTKNRNTWVISIFGGLSAFFIYGLFVDFWSIALIQQDITIESIMLVYFTAIPYNLMFAFTTFISLLLFGNPMINKIDRIKMKYGFEMNR